MHDYRKICLHLTLNDSNESLNQENYLMCPPLSPFHRYIKINIPDNCHFAPVYFLGITRLTFTRSKEQQPSIYAIPNDPIRPQNLGKNPSFFGPQIKMKYGRFKVE